MELHGAMHQTFLHATSGSLSGVTQRSWEDGYNCGNHATQQPDTQENLRKNVRICLLRQWGLSQNVSATFWKVIPQPLLLITFFKNVLKWLSMNENERMTRAHLNVNAIWPLYDVYRDNLSESNCEILVELPGKEESIKHSTPRSIIPNRLFN